MSDDPRYVTAAKAGFPESDQIKIALELILSQGGIATIQQIYSAVEEKLGDGVYLSEQGKHSLRRTINTGAVNRGYIHPYDNNNPGWRITKSGVEFIRQELGREVGEVKITARAYVNFLLATKEIRTLLDFYDDTKHTSNYHNSSLEIFKKTGIILVVTAWETFVEDISESYVNYRIENASSPNDMHGILNTIAQDWYKSILERQANRPKPPDFIKWTGDSWKQLIRDKLREDLNRLNTPNSENIRRLSKKYVGQDVTDSWRWAGMSAQQARERLDELIKLRGGVVHRTGSYFELGSSVRRDQFDRSVNFIERLATTTEATMSKLL